MSIYFVPTVELTSVAFLLVIGYGMFFENREKDLSTFLFRSVVVSCAIATATDAASYLIEAADPPTVVLYVINCCTYIFGNIFILFFAYYLVAVLNERDKTSFRFAHIFAIASVEEVIRAIVGTFLHKTFVIVDGEYYVSDWSGSFFILKSAMMLYLLVIVILKSRVLGKHDAIAFAAYIILPVSFMILEVFEPALSLSYCASALSMAILYVMFQSSAVRTAQTRERIMDELSKRDRLTGVGSRRAYDMLIAKCTGYGDRGIVFCDVNKLKYTNDTYGHEMGDRMLIRFAGILKQHFDEKGIFRISGDEFVVITEKMERVEFKMILSRLNAGIMANNQIASFGCAYGPEKLIQSLISQAEKKMYENKADFYARTGFDRRKH